MTLAQQYENQFAWRRWSQVLGALPTLDGQTVLDLGCGVGDLAAELASRGSRVIGFDFDETLLEVARARGIPGADFHASDLRSINWSGAPANGIWCSFSAAYFPRLSEVLQRWGKLLQPGGWLLLTEIDDLFGHEPVDEETRTLLRSYAEQALAANRYDFHMGGKLRSHVEASGFLVSSDFTVEDDELAFDGAAPPAVLEAWAARLGRMALLHEFCGARFEHIREQVLGALASPQHRSSARVCCCLAVKGESAPLP